MIQPLPEKLLNHPAALCNMVRRIALEAGEVTFEYFEESGYTGAEEKIDGSPVTKADQAAEELIESALAEITPCVPMIGEEAVAEGRIPNIEEAPWFWLVDPVDGTKEFIAGNPDFTVNIALIHETTPVLGVVYAPALGELYAGHGPGTAIRWNEDEDTEKKLRVRQPPHEGLTVVASRSHGDEKKVDDFLTNYKVAKLIRRGSSLKICTIAAGKADLYPRLGPTHEWDTAAADAVLRAAGGIVTTLDGAPLLYRKTENKLLNPDFIASSHPLDSVPE